MNCLDYEGIRFWNFSRLERDTVSKPWFPTYDQVPEWVFLRKTYHQGRPPAPQNVKNVVCAAPDRDSAYIENVDLSYLGEVSEVPTPSKYLEGEYYMGGYLRNLFGHFMVDSLSMLWPMELLHSENMRVLFFHPDEEVLEQAHIKYFLSLAGLQDKVVVEQEALRVESLWYAPPVFRTDHLPEDAYLSDEDFWGNLKREYAAANPRTVSSAQPLYLSRAKVGAARRYYGEKLLESVLERNGFAIAYMEELSQAEQISLVCAHSNIFSACGSACYSLFLSEHSPKLYVLDNFITPTFVYLSKKTRIQMEVVRVCVDYKVYARRHYSRDRIFDIAAVLQFLVGQGFIATDLVLDSEWSKFRNEVSRSEYRMVRRAFGRLKS